MENNTTLSGPPPPLLTALHPDDLLVVIGPPHYLPTTHGHLTLLGMLQRVATQSRPSAPSEVTIFAPIIKELPPLIQRLRAARERIGCGAESKFGVGLILRTRDLSVGRAVYFLDCEPELTEGLDIAVGQSLCAESVSFKSRKCALWDPTPFMDGALGPQ